MIDVMESAQRLVKAVTGEPYGDYETVMNVGKGTQWDDEKVWVSGNWNGAMGKRLFTALERIGVQCEYHDEVEQCSNCYKMLQSRPTHYGWQPRYIQDDEGRVCFDCLDTSDDQILEDFGYIDNAEKAIPDVLARHLETWGWAPYNGVFENGWHPGQTDKPTEIFDKIKEKEPNLSVVFRLDEVSQFYIRFTAWTKNRGEEDE
jgi:hypothetical protein